MRKALLCAVGDGESDEHPSGKQGSWEGDGEGPVRCVQVIPLRAPLSPKLVFLIQFRCRFS